MTLSSTLGERTFPTVEVTHISAHGVWLLASVGEMFMPFEHFPWFKQAPIEHILNVEEPSPAHFYWPDLDVDLSHTIIANPTDYPLVSR